MRRAETEQSATSHDDAAVMRISSLLRAVAGEGEMGRSKALELLLAVDTLDDSLAAILAAAVHNDSDANLRNGAMDTLVAFGNRAVPTLVTLLQDEDWQVRNFATVMLGDIGSRDGVKELVVALRDRDNNVRHGAAEALGKIADSSALAALLSLLSEDFWLQCPAIYALGRMKAYRAVPHLLQLLPNALLTGIVVQALADIGDQRALPSLVQLVAKADESIFPAIIEAIVRIQGEGNEPEEYCCEESGTCRPSLLRELFDEPARTRLLNLVAQEGTQPGVEAAIMLLGRLGEQRAVPSLLRRGGEPNLLGGVEKSLLAMGRDCIPQLVAGIDNAAPKVRVVIIRLLRWLGHQDHLSRLLPLLEGDDQEMQLEILDSLRQGVPQAFVPSLLRMLERDERLAFPAAELLATLPGDLLRGPVTTLASSTVVAERQRSAALLGKIPDPPLEVMTALLADPVPPVRRLAVRAVGAVSDERMIPHLLAALDDEDLSIREEAVQALARHPQSAPLSRITAMLGTGDDCLDLAIIRAVGIIGRAEGYQPLVSYLTGQGVSDLFAFAVLETLGRLGEGSSLPLVASYLDNADPDLRRLAIEAIATLRGIDPLPYLAKGVADTNWSVRIAALRALGRSRSPEALPHITKGVSDADLMVRRNALLALGDLGDRGSVTFLAKLLVDPEVGKVAFEALHTFGRQALPRLHRIMSGAYELEVRERVVELVGRIADPRSVLPLVNLLSDETPSLRLASVDALTSCFDPLPLRALKQLREHDENQGVRQRAELALATLLSEKQR